MVSTDTGVFPYKLDENSSGFFAGSGIIAQWFGFLVKKSENSNVLHNVNGKDFI